MLFREADEHDIPAMTATRLGVLEHRLSGPAWLARQLWLDGLAAAGNAKTWVCELNEGLAGFSVARIKERDICALFVDPAHEARGTGSRLLGVATDWLFESGVAEKHLNTGGNSRVDIFYQRQGWRRIELATKGDDMYCLRRTEDRTASSTTTSGGMEEKC